MHGRRKRTSSGRTILAVDDRADALASVRMLLEREGHRVLTAESAAAALALFGLEPVHLVLVEQLAPRTDGEEFVHRVRERDPLVPIVLQTRCATGTPIRDMVRHLPVQGYHDERDGPERLLLSIDVALRTYDDLVQLHLAERLKTELLASVSHEFRTPLNVMVGYLDLLRDGDFGTCPPDAIPVLDRVRGNALYLLDLVEEFLDLSRLEAGVTTVRCEAVEMTPFLRELGEWFTLLARTKPVRFVADIPDALPPAAADSAKLRVVVQNLLSNAAKFTREGEIRLSAAPLDERRLVVRVRDTGPGIPAEQQEAIFDVFHQLRPHEGAPTGVGLGLALARRFARMMGGDVTLESTVGAGSTFTVVLPTSPREGDAG